MPKFLLKFSPIAMLICIVPLTSYGQAVMSAPAAVVLTGQQAPGGSAFQTLGRPSINSSGTIVFRGGLTESIVHFGNLEGKIIPSGIFVVNNGSISKAVGYGDAVPNQSAIFSDFGDPVVNDSGNIAFVARLGQGYEKEGMFLRSAAGLTTVAVTGDPAPGTNGKFVSFSQARLSNVGAIAFAGRFDGPSAGDGIFVFSAGTVRPVVLQAQAAPITSGGIFDRFHGLSINNVGQIAFSASVSINGGEIHKHAVFAVSGAGIKPVAVEGVPLSTGTILDAVTQPSINDAGDITFIQVTARNAPFGPYYLPTGIFSATQDAISSVRVTGRRANAQEPTFNESFRQPTNIRAPDGRNVSLFIARDQNSQKEGLWLYDHSILVKLVEQGQTPLTGRNYSSIGSFAIAPSGAFVYQANVDGAAAGSGIFSSKINF